MDSIRTLSGKTQDLARPGRRWEASADGHGVEAAQNAVLQNPVYVTWSGSVGTVHRVFLFGVSGHGFGSEFA